MKIRVNEKNIIELEEVYNSICLKTNAGEKMVICMRDSGFEFNYNGADYEAKEGKVKLFPKYAGIVRKSYHEGLSGNARIAQLQQLTSLTHDGDVINKSERDKLVDEGYAKRYSNGWNIISAAGICYLESNGYIHH